MSRSGYEPQVAASASSSHGGSSPPRATRTQSRSPKRHSTYAASSAGIAATIASTVSIPKAVPFPPDAAAATTASARWTSRSLRLFTGQTIDSGRPGDNTARSRHCPAEQALDTVGKDDVDINGVAEAHHLAGKVKRFGKAR